MSEEQELSAAAMEGQGNMSEVAEEVGCYYCPVMDFKMPAERIYHFSRQFLPSMSGCKSLENNFLKAGKWSPDGSCFLTNSEDNNLRVFDIPSDALYADQQVDPAATLADSFFSAMTVSEGETVYDFCWYPHMLASDPATCVFATSSRDHPVHLWDATTGKLRCTYRAYDGMDEIATAYSIAFNPTGTKLFCGYNKSLRVFDTSRPGREFSQYSTTTSAKDGQTGIISCLAFNHGYSGLLAAGSYNQTTALYNEENAELLYVLHGQEGGVTQVLFSRDGNYLYAGGRKDPYILCWDVRQTAGLVYRLPRNSTCTNQRMMFDIEPCGQHLATGGQDGNVRIFDLQTGEIITEFQAALDTVNSFSFHPSLPLGLSTSGHRRFDLTLEDDIVESNDHNLNEQENCASIWRFAYTWASMGFINYSWQETYKSDEFPEAQEEMKPTPQYLPESE